MNTASNSFYEGSIEELRNSLERVRVAKSQPSVGQTFFLIEDPNALVPTFPTLLSIIQLNQLTLYFIILGTVIHRKQPSAPFLSALVKMKVLWL